MSMELPKVNDLVRVELDDKLALPSRVENVDGLELVLAAPRYVGNVTPPSPGDPVTVHWTARGGLSGLPAQFVAANRTPMPVWRVRVRGEAEVVQRRRYVRMPVGAPVTLTHLGHSSIRVGHILDLSEGGVRVRVSSDGSAVRDQVVVRLALDDEVVDIEGTILRAVAIGGGMDEVVITFEDDHRFATSIRRFVFRQQARLRRAGKV